MFTPYTSTWREGKGVAYHHGDLAAALVEAGLDVTREGGFDALSIREVTRRIGVSPNAAYRHYPSLAALREAVAAAILEQVAASMSAGTASDPAARLRTIGLAYIDFALREPGWFSVAFFGGRTLGPADIATTPAFRALESALGGMIARGSLTADAAPAAAWSCWATVHGFAELCLHGPLAAMPSSEQRSLAASAVDAIVAGIRPAEHAPDAAG
ncbi:TetR/AcrR family transcriptional regulator [Microbacterium sp. KUDC0406]|uniref:TetR/AcrR family transcriptional regulator n=1 Tax=Microbacterium sp. KUDC0406 TaxID=2909588 RepID=UPI001F1ED0EC|nr:TetR/AcrR family transcriptional regulator [Microbacterium sp. KUDC0406]UJP09671.1 TetR/AcrR family transcriptional regulator [Microbacterium sp. KUDC0406]